MLWRERPIAVAFLPPLEGGLSTDNATQLRDAYETFREVGGDVGAIAHGAPERVAAFATQWRLPFTVFADDGAAYTAFGLRTETGVQPGSFVIDREGIVRYAYRVQGEFGYPSTSELIRQLCALTGARWELPPLTPPGVATGLAASAPPPTAGARSYACVKCGCNEHEVVPISTAGGFLSRLFNVQHRRFSAVVCARCKYAELYRVDASALSNVLDVIAGG